MEGVVWASCLIERETDHISFWHLGPIICLKPDGFSDVRCMQSLDYKQYARRASMQDPHFKAGTHRRRIISRAQLADYAYLLAPGGMLYTITDVPELGKWMREKASLHSITRAMHAGCSKAVAIPSRASMCM